MNAYALVYNFTDDVNGEGFLARVTAQGRALAVNEGDGWWVYGVEPGGIAASGETPREACHEFRQAFTKVLYDFAADVKVFDDFTGEVRRFFHERDGTEEERWSATVAALRGRSPAEGPFHALPTVTEEPARVAVERLDEAARSFTPSENRLPEYALTTAA